jgi:hypothetical protein
MREGDVIDASGHKRHLAAFLRPPGKPCVSEEKFLVDLRRACQISHAQQLQQAGFPHQRLGLIFDRSASGDEAQHAEIRNDLFRKKSAAARTNGRLALFDLRPRPLPSVVFTPEGQASQPTPRQRSMC